MDAKAISIAKAINAISEALIRVEEFSGNSAIYSFCIRNTKSVVYRITTIRRIVELQGEEKKVWAIVCESIMTRPWMMPLNVQLDTSIIFKENEIEEICGIINREGLSQWTFHAVRDSYRLSLVITL